MPQKKGFRHSEESKRKIREATKGANNPFYGRTHSLATRKKISKNRKLRYKTSKPYWLGKKRSEETKRKISLAKQGNKNHYQGGETIDNGYKDIFLPDHPFAKKSGYVKEHRIIVENIIGRCLKKSECVHHINKIRTDNRPENLMCFVGNGAHVRFERGKPIKLDEIIFDGRNYTTP